MNLPSVELLEQMHQFPGDYTFKIIGESTPSFPNNVLEAAARILSREPTHTLRYTKGGRHVSITLDARVKSAEEVRDVYRTLVQVPGVVMVL